MTAHITFSTYDNVVTFLSMAEGLWTNFRDDNEAADEAVCDRMMWEINEALDQADAAFPKTLLISSAVVEMATRVLENCLDVSESRDSEDLEMPDEDLIFEGQVTITA
jgi:hypothetical protein